MIFNLDTENYENIKLKIKDTDGDEMQNLIQEFCFGLASFYMAFCLNAKIGQESAKKLKSTVLEIIDHNIDVMIADSGSVLKPEVDDEGIENLRNRMQEAGYNDDEIENIISIVSDLGINGAIQLMGEIAMENGIDLSEYGIDLDE